MTSKEALERLKFIWDKETNTGSKSPKELDDFWGISKPLKVIDKLVERDTPMKPIVNVDLDGITKYNCPKCVCTLNIPIIEINGCPKCLQRIDWGE